MKTLRVSPVLLSPVIIIVTHVVIHTCTVENGTQPACWEWRTQLPVSTHVTHFVFTENDERKLDDRLYKEADEGE